MKTGFKNATAIKQPKKKNPYWSFECPPYDERSSCFVNAGTNYGVGHKTPTGTFKHSNFNAVPVGRPKTLETDHIYRGNPGLIDSGEKE